MLVSPSSSGGGAVGPTRSLLLSPRLPAHRLVGTDIAQQVRDYLKGGAIQSAVNFYSLAGDLYDRVRPAMDLAQRLGPFLAQARPGSIEPIALGVYGDLRETLAKAWAMVRTGGRVLLGEWHWTDDEPTQRIGLSVFRNFRIDWGVTDTWYSIDGSTIITAGIGDNPLPHTGVATRTTYVFLYNQDPEVNSPDPLLSLIHI